MVGAHEGAFEVEKAEDDHVERLENEPEVEGGEDPVAAPDCERVRPREPRKLDPNHHPNEVRNRHLGVALCRNVAEVLVVAGKLLVEGSPRRRRGENRDLRAPSAQGAQIYKKPILIRLYNGPLLRHGPARTGGARTATANTGAAQGRAQARDSPA